MADRRLHSPKVLSDIEERLLSAYGREVIDGTGIGDTSTVALIINNATPAFVVAPQTPTPQTLAAASPPPTLVTAPPPAPAVAPPPSLVAAPPPSLVAAPPPAPAVAPPPSILAAGATQTNRLSAVPTRPIRPRQRTERTENGDLTAFQRARFERDASTTAVFKTVADELSRVADSNNNIATAMQDMTTITREHNAEVIHNLQQIIASQQSMIDRFLTRNCCRL